MSGIANFFKQLSVALEPEQRSAVSSDDIERISAVLLVEIARADHNIAQTERLAILAALSASSSLTPEELEALVDEAVQGADAAHPLHEHISVINDRFSGKDKVELVEQMWRVAVADGDIDRYEDYTIRKICDLLYVKHKVFMQAKLSVLAERE